MLDQILTEAALSSQDQCFLQLLDEHNYLNLTI